jgi:plasmid stability protein
VTILVTVAGRPYPGVMTLTVHLPRELAAALEAEAARRGQSADQVAADLLAAQLPASGARRRLAFAGVGSSTSGRNAADADDMLAEGFGRDE